MTVQHVDRDLLIEFVDEYVNTVEGEWGDGRSLKDDPHLRLDYDSYYRKFGLILDEEGNIRPPGRGA